MPTNQNQDRTSRTPLSGSQGAGGQEYTGQGKGKAGRQGKEGKDYGKGFGSKDAQGYGSEESGGKEFGGSRTRGGQEYATKGKGREYTGEDTESGRSEAGAGRQRGERLRAKRDPSGRVTSKPDVTLEQTSKTSILRTCADTLHETFVYCLDQGGKHVEGDHLKCLIDTAELCGFTANFVARGSEHSDKLLAVCAEACKCAEEHCEEFGDDETMKACADVCRECYEHCNAQASQKVA